MTIKQSLIDEMNKRVEDKILERTNADLLIKLINQAASDNEAMMIAELGTTYKRTGLHFDKRLEKMTSDIRYFRKNNDLSFHTDDSKPTHKLIIGDNYEALQNLLIQYKGKIDVIYIDPPYGKDNMGEFAKTNYDNAITRDNLLSMLYPRLQLAKQLLSNEGVIFCSIDDRNQAYVKCLFDEVFGEENFIGNLIVKSNPRGSMSEAELAKLHEYITTYSKNNSAIIFRGQDLTEEMKEEYDLVDENGEKYRALGLRMRGGFWRRSERPKLFYPIYVNPKDGAVSIEKSDVFTESVLPIQPSTNEDGTWRWSKDTVKENLNLLFGKEVTRNGKIVWDVFQKDYYEKDGERKTKTRSIWDDKKYNYQNGTIEVKNIFNGTVFLYPKPTSLIEDLIGVINNQSSIVLDFFAGSGTTGHSVLDLNKQNDGNRTFILCQLNENLDEALKSTTGTSTTIIENQIALCNKYKRPHELSEITAERLRRVMTGSCYDGSKDFQWLKDNEPYGGNLDVYEIASVNNAEYHEKKSPFEVIDETLYGHEKFKTLKEKVDWVCQNFNNAQKTAETDDEWLKRTREK